MTRDFKQPSLDPFWEMEQGKTARGAASFLITALSLTLRACLQIGVLGTFAAIFQVQKDIVLPFT